MVQCIFSTLLMCRGYTVFLVPSHCVGGTWYLSYRLCRQVIHSSYVGKYVVFIVHSLCVGGAQCLLYRLSK